MTGRESTTRWDGNAYRQQATHHRRFDDAFLERQPPRPDDRVVDLGCGPGDFTLWLADRVPDGIVLGVDPDPSMLASARARASTDNVGFREGRAQDLDRVIDPGWADLVVSRAMFHWVPFADYRRCYQAVWRVLAPGGWFHAESGGAGNVHRIKVLMDEVAAAEGLGPSTTTFATPGQVHDLLEEVGFEIPDGGVRTVAQRRPFDRDGLAGWIATQAVHAYPADTDEDRARFLAAVDARLDEARRHDGSYDQTFVRLEVLCQRPD